jgi:hypothetical protein
MRKPVTLRVVTISCLIALFVTDRVAFAQAGSVGGTIGKTDKSASGGDEGNSPALPARHRQKRNTSPQMQSGISGIQITSATLGANCGGPHGNVSGKVGQMCNGKETCWVQGATVRDPDPCPGHAKDFSIQWRCGTGGTLSKALPAEWGEPDALELSCK